MNKFKRKSISAYISGFFKKENGTRYTENIPENRKVQS